MVGILEAGLVVGALGLDIYAYKKMKDAEASAENAVRERERERFKTTAGVQVEMQPDAAPVAAGATVEPEKHVQTMLVDHAAAHEDHATAHTEWKPVTYESVAPVETTEEEIVAASKTSVDAEEIKKQYRAIADKLDVIDERINDQDTKISVMETKFEHLDGELEKSLRQFRSLDEQWQQTNEQLSNVEVPQEQIEVIVDKRFSKTSERFGGQLKEQTKKLAEVEAKLDSHLIAAADPVLIKRDLREEFTPLLSEPKRLLEEHAAENRKDFKALSVRITAAKNAAIEEAKTKATKTEVSRIVASIKAKPAAKTIRKTTVTIKKTSKAARKAPAKTTKTKKPFQPKGKIQTAVHEFAKSRKAKKTAAKGEVTVTTQVPKGVNVSTEVVTGGKKE